MLVGAVSPEYVKVQAALYADGSVSGNPEKIKQLIAHRSLTLETTRELIRRIETAQSNGTSKLGIIDILKQWSSSLGNLYEKGMIALAIGKLEQQSIEPVLSNLKHAEQALASGKSALP